MKLARYQDVLDFWFAPENADLLFEKNDDFDSEIRQCFEKLGKPHVLAYYGSGVTILTAASQKSLFSTNSRVTYAEATRSVSPKIRWHSS